MGKGKNANGEGSFYQRKSDKLWVGIVTVEGQRRQVSSMNKVTAKQKYDELRAEYLTGTLRPSKDQKLVDYLGSWLDGTKKKGLTPHSFEAYLGAIGHVTDRIGTMPLGKITPADIERVENELLTKYTAVYVRWVHARLSAALQMAVDRGLIHRNPTRTVSLPRVARREMLTLTAEQASELVQASADTRYGPLFFILLHTGLRFGEACALRWTEDVSFAQRRIIVQRTTCLIPGGGIGFNPPKTDSSIRTVSMSEDVASVLRDWQRRQAHERTAEGYWLEGDLIFSQKTGRPYGNYSVRLQLDKHTKALGLPPIRIHDLRHTCATLLMQNGIPIKVISEMLGHSKTSTTMDLYAHTLPSMHDAAAALIGTLLRPKNVVSSDKPIC